MPFEIVGGDQFGDLAARIRRNLAANRLVPNMRDGFIRESPAMHLAVLRSADTYLPDRYAAAMRPDLNIEPNGTVAGNTASTTFTATANGRHIGIINAGNLRHPLFGHGPWYDQTGSSVRPGSISEPMDSRRQELRAAVVQALRNFLQDMTRG